MVSTVSSLKPLQGIQLLRAFAALLVVAVHMGGVEIKYAEQLGMGDSSLLRSWTRNGIFGVDLFFVISGFIMVYVTQTNDTDRQPLKFLHRRVLRIYPTWWLFAGLALIGLLVMGVGSSASEYIEHGGSGYIVKSLLLIPQPFVPVLSVGWTLIHEMYFYIVFALLLALRLPNLLGFLAVWAALVILGAYLLEANPHARNIAELAAHPLTLEFIAGCVTGWLFLNRRLFRPGLVFAVGLTLFLCAFFLSPAPTPFTLKWGRVLVTTIPCAMMVYGMAGLQPYLKGPLVGALARVGDWSYSLYVSHFLTLLALPIVLAKLAGIMGATSWLSLGQPGIIDNVIYIAFSLIACLIVAALGYYLFERPVLQLSRKLLDGRPPAPISKQPR